MLRRLVGATIAGAALLATFGCGGGGNAASVRSGAVHDGALTEAAQPNAANPGLQTITYHGVQFDVPAGWAVHDLSADPSTCVRFDVNAVYLGAPGADMACPAGIVGRADAVLVQPVDGVGAADTSAGDGVSATTASGLPVQVSSDAAVSHEVAADVPSAGVNVTLSYQSSDATAQQILQSFRAAS